MRFAETHTGPLYELAKLVADCWNSRAILEPFSANLGGNETFGAADGAVLYVGQFTTWGIGSLELYVEPVPGGVAAAASIDVTTQITLTCSVVRAVNSGDCVTQFIGYRLTRS